MTRWIPITDKRKPKARQQVIVVHKHHNTEMARYVGGHFIDAASRDNKSTCELDDVIVAWSPIPRVTSKTLKQMNDAANKLR